MSKVLNKRYPDLKKTIVEQRKIPKPFVARMVYYIFTCVPYPILAISFWTFIIFVIWASFKTQPLAIILCALFAIYAACETDTRYDE